MRLTLPYKYKPLFAIFFFLSIFGLPNIALIVMQLSNLNISGTFIEINHFLSTVSIIALPLLIFGIQPRLYLKVLTPFVALVPALLYSIISYQKPPTVWMLYTIYETNFKELAEFILANSIWLIVISILPAAYYILTHRLVSKSTILSLRQRVMLGILCIMILILNIPIGNKNQSLARIKRKPINLIITNTPLHTIKKAIKAKIQFRNDQLNFVLKDDVNINMDVTDSDSIRKVIVIVLGESSRYANWQVNGYYRNTSPNLSTTSNLLSYQNIISPSYNTSKSLPIILTSANESNLYSVPHTSLFSIFQQANYSTYWISNQSNRGSMLISRIVEQADSSLFIHSENLHDKALAQHLENILEKDSNNLFIILHTIGNHYPYYKRYSADFVKFTPTTKSTASKVITAKNKLETINNYDNSILYTDSFISDCINTIDQHSASSMLWFISDHGENLFDNNDLGYGRGFNKLSKHLFHIPLFIWASEQYITNNPKKWNYLKNNQSQKISTTNIIHSICEITNINWLDSDSTMNFAHQCFVPRERFFMDRYELRNYDDYFMIDRKVGSTTTTKNK